VFGFENLFNSQTGQTFSEAGIVIYNELIGLLMRNGMSTSTDEGKLRFLCGMLLKSRPTIVIITIFEEKSLQSWGKVSRLFNPISGQRETGTI
jgi:hypothetical protein